MHDLTQGSIPRHIIRMAAPLAIGMVFQTLYFLVDLYFVAQLGDTALAGVGAAGIVQFVIMALTQVLGVGTMVLIAHAATTVHALFALWLLRREVSRRRDLAFVPVAA